LREPAIADAILKDRERRKSDIVCRRAATEPEGCFIACQCCAREFESFGWAYCPTCMEVPAEERASQ